MDIDLDDLLASEPKQLREAVDRKFKQLVEEFGVKFVREAMGKTQTEVARRMGCSQAHVSKLERQSDMLLSTLKEYVEANDGALTMTIAFPGGSVAFESLNDLALLPPLTVYPTVRQLVCHEKGTQTVFSIFESGARPVRMSRDQSPDTTPSTPHEFVLDQLTA